MLPFNDPLLKDQWHYKNTGQTGFGDADINLFKAWEITTGANNIIVAVHDEGVDVMHEDLKGNIWVNGDEIAGNGIDDDSNGTLMTSMVSTLQKIRELLMHNFMEPTWRVQLRPLTIMAKVLSGVAGGNGSGTASK